MITKTSRPATTAPKNNNEYEFIPADPRRPIYYAVCSSREAAEHANQNDISMWRKIK